MVVHDGSGGFQEGLERVSCKFREGSRKAQRGSHNGQERASYHTHTPPGASHAPPYTLSPPPSTLSHCPPCRHIPPHAATCRHMTLVHILGFLTKPCILRSGNLTATCRHIPPQASGEGLGEGPGEAQERPRGCPGEARRGPGEARRGPGEARRGPVSRALRLSRPLLCFLW